MNKHFEAYVARLQAAHGTRFSADGLAMKFRPYMRQRIEVRFSCGTVKRGFVGGTTGWQPSLMLVLKRNSSGSSWLLSDKDELLRMFNDWR